MLPGWTPHKNGYRPLSNHHPNDSLLRRMIIRAKLVSRKYIILGLVAIFLIPFVLKSIRDTTARWNEEPNPEVLFKEVVEFERNLPQHNEQLPWPEGKNGRYLFASAEYLRLGWNNILQAQLLQAYVAQQSKRGYVFMPYVPTVHVDEGSKLLSAAIPAALYSYAPSTGAPFPQSPSWSGDKGSVPRSISQEYFEKICPEERRTKVDLPELFKKLGVDIEDQKVHGHTIATKLADALFDMPETCVELTGSVLFHYTYATHPRVLPLWPTYGHSPVLTHFKWSSWILDSIKRNNFILKSPDNPNIIPKLPGLIALHVRRGDFEEHCRNLKVWNSPFNSWNSLGLYSNSTWSKPKSPHYNQDKNPVELEFVNKAYPQLPDTIYGAADGSEVDQHPPITHQDHCWPSPEMIRRKIAKISKDHPNLKKIHLMTNGDGDWLESVIGGLGVDGWPRRSITTSKDIKLRGPATAASQAVDMAIAHSAEVFVGNGWSSLSSNLAQIKLAQGYDTRSIYFF